MRGPLSPKEVAMNERQWEIYRLSVVEGWPESPYKSAVLAAIERRLMILGRDLTTPEKLWSTRPRPTNGPGKYDALERFAATDAR
jgi:hypothetical protein